MRERSLGNYLLLPRPGDLVKAWIFPAAFAFGALGASGLGAAELLRAAVVWLALELLIYQARYQWNDIRGFAADQRHPDKRSRGRLPGPPSRGRAHIRASRLVMFLRLGLCAGLALGMSQLDLAQPLLALAVAVFGVAFLYESLRSQATGRSGRVPPPVTPGVLALWGIVGAGYAIRGLAGLSQAVDVFGDPRLLASSVVAFWSFGIAFVTGRWALEAIAFARRNRRGGIEWRVEPGQAREHSLALVRWLPKTAPKEQEDLSGWKTLRDAVPVLSPWNLAAVVAAAAAAATGLLLGDRAGAGAALLAFGAGALAAGAVLAIPRRRFLGLLLGALAIGLAAAVAGWPRPALVALPWLCLLGAHLFFTDQSPRTLAHPLRRAIAAAWPRGDRPEWQPLSTPPLARRWR